MLVLSRKVGQTIQIGRDIRITVTQIRGKNIRLGIEAPKEVPIRREELSIEQPLPTSTLACSVDYAPQLV